MHMCVQCVSTHVDTYTHSCVCVNMYVYSLVAQMVKNLPVMQETQVWSLGWEDPLEKAMVTNSSIKEFHGQRSLVLYI